MPPLFSRLLYFDERAVPGTPAWNMALDEAILRSASGPVLRVYAWDRPAVSCGYFIPLAQVRQLVGPGMTAVRRWTGGGVVMHGEDLTWSLIVPASDAFFSTRPAESYLRIHAACAAALTTVAGVEVTQVSAAERAPDAGLCFAQPAPGDLLLAQKKIIGAGQRRTRQGLLHQASMSGVALAADFPAHFAAGLAENVEPWLPGDDVLRHAGELEASRYGTPEWTARC